jgi:thiamine pyrophosphate-dependent acetolactate synthase large subunit-like protein
MNWNELIAAKNERINMVLLLCNNGGYKSLETSFMKRYGIEYQQKSTFNSVDINIKKICE